MGRGTAALNVIIMVTLLLVSGCSSQPAAPQEQPAVDSPVKEFDVTAQKFEFIPGEIVVNKGDTVVLHIMSKDVTHGFAINAYDINEHLEPGREVTVRFVADKEGEFTFYCSVPCGSGHNTMQGKLVVR